MTASTSTAAIAAAHPNVAAAMPGVNVLQGIINFGEHMIGSLTAGAAAIANTAIPSVTGQPGSSSFFGTLGNVKAAAAKLSEIIADARKGDIQEAIADALDLLKLIFATLDVFHINVPVLTTVVEGLGSPHAGGVDKPA